MIWMREKDIRDTILMMTSLIKNRDNWLISRDKDYIIKISGMDKPMAGKIAYISTLNEQTLLSLAVIKGRFSFRHFRFIPYIMIMNVPLSNVEYIVNAFPEFYSGEEKEEEKEEQDISYI